MVLSGGSRIDDDVLLQQTREIMEAGGSGVIYGRNVWQRERSAALVAKGAHGGWHHFWQVAWNPEAKAALEVAHEAYREAFELAVQGLPEA